MTAMQTLMEWMIEESQVIPVDTEDTYNKAKELLSMEKEQIIKARNSYIKQMYNKSIDSLIHGEVNHKILTSEQYYNETYGK